ncbi:COP9 signalosome complex subunit 7-like isoform X2 [Populus nigra]|uniref:COP9 signalosome complex subunit 7-like isoform X2 n=1 Tax=Populus nigra TaxID=3691 RepID=UPI002B27A8FA|nr:COP9 signalosome complex subunit 7-like isoform X2 [Populus nigra]XP_061980729.1 COP9 signalosome complex subunit 7-like isoform X2 [Populus nigra]
MEIEEGQAQVIQKFVNKASTLETTSSLANLIVEATSHPSLFAFSEILSLPNILQLQGTEDSAYIDLLRLFGYGTWRDYKGNSAMLPKLSQDQILKLKQLTVLTLSETNKVLSYNKLQEELEVSNVRELEDFLINDCMIRCNLQQRGISCMGSLGV